jgi:hypothetical protein
LNALPPTLMFRSGGILGNTRSSVGCSPSHPRASHSSTSLQRQQTKPFIQDISGGVMVPVMFGSAVRAHTLADAKRLHLNLPMPAARAQLAGREDARDTSHRPPVPCRFILKHIEKTPPSGIGNGFGKLAVFLHAPHTQVLHVHHLVFADRAGGQLMQEIVPAVGDFFMKTAHSEATFLFHTPIPNVP